jgi:hypothetical protein
MRTTFRVAALLVGLAVIVFWLFGGPNTGWTRNRVTIKEKDPVTGLEVDRFQDRYVPGVDFLAEGLAVAAVLGGCSFFFRRSIQTKPA